MVFDFHFHLLLKQYLSGEQNIDSKVRAAGMGGIINSIMGGAIDSQASPSQIKDSPVRFGVVALITLEHAFANRILRVLGMDFSGALPIDKDLVKQTKNGDTTYYNEFTKQLKFYIDNKNDLRTKYKINFITRNSFQNKSLEDTERAVKKYSESDERYFVFSIEGGHNLSTAKIRDTASGSKHPEINLMQLQDRNDCDFISMNLAHLSEIPEQSLCGFAQGVNKMAEIAFSSEDFYPVSGLGLTGLGKKVVRQALTHETKPVLIDVKHASVYSRFDYYRFRERLIQERPEVERLPVICSHSGFTFTTLQRFLNEKEFSLQTEIKYGLEMTALQAKNRKIGRTDDVVNSGLYANPWSINLFDEEIVEIMQSGGMIGIIMDQRVLGATEVAMGSRRSRYFEEEYISQEEAQRLFVERRLPTEGLEALEGLVPRRAERHMMLFCLHIVHAIRVGKEFLPWIKDKTSPWDHVCLGSDYDGLINPINGFEDVTRLNNLESQLKKYLPLADKTLPFYPQHKALRYDEQGYIDSDYLSMAINKFLSGNGLRFLARFMSNWQQD